MTLREAIKGYADHQKNSVRNKTRESYAYLFRNLETLLGQTTFSEDS
jgi:hypothetical protein